MKHALSIFRMDAAGALRSPWFWAYAAAVILSCASLFAAGITESRVMGFTGLTRVLLIFIQASNLVLPVLILIATVRTLVKERETNVFEYLLSFPVGLAEYFFGKALGQLFVIVLPLLAAMALSVLLGFIGAHTVPWDVVLLYTALLFASSVFYVGLGFMLSSIARSQEIGLGLALFVWLLFIALLDIALLGLLMKGMASEEVVFAIALANPIQIFKIAAISLFDPVLSVIGPAAYFILDSFGSTGFMIYSLGFLLVGGIGFLLAGFAVFKNRDLV